MDPLKVTHGVLRYWRAGAGLAQGHQHASSGRLISVPPIQACCQHAWCLACRERRVLSLQAVELLFRVDVASQLFMCCHELSRLCF